MFFAFLFFFQNLNRDFQKIFFRWGFSIFSGDFIWFFGILFVFFRKIVIFFSVFYLIFSKKYSNSPRTVAGVSAAERDGGGDKNYAPLGALASCFCQVPPENQFLNVFWAFKKKLFFWKIFEIFLIFSIMGFFGKWNVTFCAPPHPHEPRSLKIIPNVILAYTEVW